MTAYHFCFDLNHFGWIHQDFNTSWLWLAQRSCILGLFLICAGGAQAIAVSAGQNWKRFWRRWLQIAGCALLVSIGSAQMFPESWIYFGVLHGIAVMLIVCRLSVGWGNWLWLAGAMALAAGIFDHEIHLALVHVWPGFAALNDPRWNWIGLVSHKPYTEDHVPLLPWLGLAWWGMAAVKSSFRHAITSTFDRTALTLPFKALAFVGRWSLSWYMLHQLVMIGILTFVYHLAA